MARKLEPKVKPRLELETDGGTEAIVSRGLPALHPYTQVPLSWIETNPNQPRQHFDPERLGEMVEDIRRHGIDTPLVVRSVGPNRYLLVAGERRLRAARELNLPTVPVFVRDDLSESEADLLGLRENLQREDLTPLETARGLQRYKAVSGATWDQVAAEFGRSRKSLLEIVALLKAPEAVQALLEARQISTAHAVEIASLPEEQQVALARRAAEEAMTARALRALRRELEAGRPGSPEGVWSHVDVTNKRSMPGGEDAHTGAPGEDEAGGTGPFEEGITSAGEAGSGPGDSLWSHVDVTNKRSIPGLESDAEGTPASDFSGAMPPREAGTAPGDGLWNPSGAGREARGSGVTSRPSDPVLGEGGAGERDGDRPLHGSWGESDPAPASEIRVRVTPQMLRDLRHLAADARMSSAAFVRQMLAWVIDQARGGKTPPWAP